MGPQAAQCGQNGRDTQRAESKRFTHLNVPKDPFLELVCWRRILSIRFKWKHQRFTYRTYVGISPGWSSIYSTASFDIGDTLEIAAQCAIAKDDIPAFERALAQLKPFYFDLEWAWDDSSSSNVNRSIQKSYPRITLPVFIARSEPPLFTFSKSSGWFPYGKRRFVCLCLDDNVLWR